MDRTGSSGRRGDHLLRAGRRLLVRAGRYRAGWLGLVVRGAVIGWQAVRAWYRWLLAGLIAGCSAGLAFGLTDELAPGAKAGLFFWLVLGLLAGTASATTERS